MNQEIQSTEAPKPPMVPPTAAELLAEAGVSAADLVIPKLLLMQGTSEYVGDESAEVGDIVNSQTHEVLGGIGKPVEFVPLKLYKTWRIYDMSSKQPKFLREEPVTAANADQEWEGLEGKTPVRRDQNFNFFILLKSELDAGEAFPCVVSFKRTSMNAGKQLATQLFKLAALGKLPYSQTVKLGVRKDKKETNTYAVYEFQKGNPCTEVEKTEAQRWLKTLSSVKYTVDAKEEAEAVPTAPSVQSGGSNPPVERY